MIYKLFDKKTKGTKTRPNDMEYEKLANELNRQTTRKSKKKIML